jgi:hypothetical protein
LGRRESAINIVCATCLPTTLPQVANLAFYSPDRAYGGRVDYMAHEDVMGLEGMN